MTFAAILAFMQTPIGMAAVAYVAYRFGPQLAALAPILGRLLPSKPASPTDPQPIPLTPANTPVKPMDLIDASLMALKALALKRFPYLSPDRALFTYAGKLHEEQEEAELQKTIEAAKLADK
jgi:hypothetical protein